MATAEQIAVLDEYSAALFAYQQAKQARLAAEVALDVAVAEEKTVGKRVGDVRARLYAVSLPIRAHIVSLAEGGQDDEINIQPFNRLQRASGFNGLTVRDLLS